MIKKVEGNKNLPMDFGHYDHRSVLQDEHIRPLI